MWRAAKKHSESGRLEVRTYIIRRVLQMIPVFLGIIIILFFIVDAAPGDYVAGMINPKLSAEQQAALREKLDPDAPVIQKFWNWLTEVFQGNLGYSLSHQKPVTEVIGSLIGPTFQLSICALIVAILVGVPCGIISATRQYSKLDTGLTIFSLVGISIPSFFFGLLLIKFLAVDLGWFPVFGLRDVTLMNANFFVRFFDGVWHMILPVTVLGLSSAASFMRYTRSAMLEVIRQDYIRTARAKGLKERVVIYRHAFRNGMIPIITLIGFWIPSLFSGAIMTESVFGLPGLGKVMVEAVAKRNEPLIIGICALLAVLTLVAALAADILYAVADPRIRYD